MNNKKSCPSLGENSTIDNSVQLGKNVTIGNNCKIIGNVVIGDDCVIENNVNIMNNVTIGSGNTILSGTNIGYIGQMPRDRHYDISKKAIVIGDNNYIRENSTIHLPHSTALTKIGNNCYLMVNAHISHDTSLGNDVVICNNVAIGGVSEIHDYANVGLNTALHQSSRIGQHAMIGMGSMITMDVLPFSLVYGQRKSISVSINKVGIERHYKGSFTIREIWKALRNIAEGAVDDISPNNELNLLYTTFIKNSKNGVYTGKE